MFVAMARRMPPLTDNFHLPIKQHQLTPLTLFSNRLLKDDVLFLNSDDQYQERRLFRTFDHFYASQFGDSLQTVSFISLTTIF